MTSMTKICIIGGRRDGRTYWIEKTPPRIWLGGDIYERIDDPDTGEFLGAYAYAVPQSPGSAGPARGGGCGNARTGPEA